MPSFTAAQQNQAALVTGAGMPSLEANAVISAIMTLAQNGSSVAITGGTIDGTVIGGTTAAAITGTTITGSSTSATPVGLFGSATAALTGPASTQSGTVQINSVGDSPAAWANGSIFLNAWIGTTAAPVFVFTKSRGVTVGANTAVQNGDALGQYNFRGADGTNYPNGARIQATVDNTVSTGVVPTKLTFDLADPSTGTLTTALTLASSRAATLAGALTLLGGAQFLTTSSALTDYAAAQTATLTNGPVAGNPTKWIAINDNGTVRKIPTWS